MSITGKLVRKISLSSNVEIVQEFSGVFTDSRKEMKDGLFVPLVGERFDGHEFLLHAIQNGAIAAVWEKGKQIPREIPNQFPLFFVEDTLVALQEMAKVYLEQIQPTVIGVTGSNGKTTTKDIITAVLSTTYSTHKTNGNFNNEIGLPLTVLAMPASCEVLILEMGMSGLREIALLSEIARPHYAVVTNIGESHIEQLGSREAIAKAKMEIAEGLRNNGKVIIDGDEPLLFPYTTNEMITCGFSEQNDVTIVEYEGDDNGFTFRLQDSNFQYSLPLLGKHNVHNAAYAIIIGKLLNVEEKNINEGLNQIALTSMRLEKKQGKSHSIIIDDAYNASPTSMRAAIEVIKELPYEKKIVVLGDIYELGPDEESLHRSVASAVDKPITHVYTIGSKGKWIYDELQKNSHNTMVVKSFENKEEVIAEILPLLDEKTIVLVKASRGMKLETIVEQLIS
ncbi:UDP-N-acetylmuramoyl-tripeptide--D-alanyl-D-alanine ligase [Alkalihalobacterium bogoriense]|uniref:UDP-N-acetylmuramoyl-tripeptide--D-alanyl-D- alanine ligase n=1 Tax=Alkalihalobacterium bogoriense TaxID=246272 RepID=UPI00047C3987|nr:UDP-N-acetylmuramoyl-tripeptide--D-alanyl-D-alanine ligase [Alkalihalobacterium bogoriense]